MRFIPASAFFTTVWLAVTAASWPQFAAAQSGRDFVLENNGGHLIIRFVGKADSLDALEKEDIADISLSTMVPHRLRADVAFEAEPVDSKWAKSMKPRIRSALSAISHDFTSIHIACRSATCRLVLEHSNGESVSGDRALMDSVQDALQALVKAHPRSFAPGLLIAAHYQPTERAKIKAFLRRATVHGEARTALAAARLARHP